MALPVESPLALVEAGSTPAAPSAGNVLFYAKTDGKLYMQTPNGTEMALGTSNLVPIKVTAGSAYTVPAGTQVPYNIPIDVQGTLDVQGVLVSVD